MTNLKFMTLATNGTQSSSFSLTSNPSHKLTAQPQKDLCAWLTANHKHHHFLMKKKYMQTPRN